MQGGDHRLNAVEAELLFDYLLAGQEMWPMDFGMVKVMGLGYLYI